MKIRMGIQWPGSSYNDNNWGKVYDLDNITPISLIHKIERLAKEIEREGEGEIVIYPEGT